MYKRNTLIAVIALVSSAVQAPLAFADLSDVVEEVFRTQDMSKSLDARNAETKVGKAPRQTETPQGAQTPTKVETPIKIETPVKVEMARNIETSVEIKTTGEIERTKHVIDLSTLDGLSKEEINSLIKNGELLDQLGIELPDGIDLDNLKGQLVIEEVTSEGATAIAIAAAYSSVTEEVDSLDVETPNLDPNDFVNDATTSVETLTAEEVKKLLEDRGFLNGADIRETILLKR